MSTSAKRLGLEVRDNLELELRLRRIEVALEKRLLANDSEGLSRSRLTPPQITGFAVSGQTPGTVTMKWNASPIADLRRYQIQFAEDAGFSINLQSFNTRDVQFTFSTASATGGASGTTFFSRVRAQNSIGQFGVFSVVINTSTGQVVGGDLDDGAVDTASVEDGAITADKIDIPSLIAELTLPGPIFDAGDSNKFVRVNADADSFEVVAGTLPDLAAAGDAGKLIRVAGSNNLDYTPYTFPNTATTGKLLRGNGTNWVETGFTFPSTATNNNYLRGDGANFALREGTLPPLAAGGDADKIVSVSAADTLVYTSIDPSDAAGTAGGAAGNNRSGTLTLPGGFILKWDTVNVADSTNVDVTGLTATVKTVLACAASTTATSSLTPGVSSWVLSSTSIRLHQDNADLEAVDVTYYVISES